MTTGRPLIAIMGDGLDALTASIGSYVKFFIPSNFGGWILVVAVFVTVWSVIKAIRALRGPVGGAGDAGRLVSYGMRRTAIAAGLCPQSVVWGVVRETGTGRPLPLAAVTLASPDGSVMDTCVSDPHGRYGFRLPYAETVARGYRGRLEVRKSGYYPAGIGRELALLAGEHPGVDLSMDVAGRTAPTHAPAVGPLSRIAGTAAFWTGVVVVPMAFLRAPGVGSALLLTAFCAAVIVRAVWSRHPKP